MHGDGLSWGSSDPTGWTRGVPPALRAPDLEVGQDGTGPLDFAESPRTWQQGTHPEPHQTERCPFCARCIRLPLQRCRAADGGVPGHPRHTAGRLSPLPEPGSATPSGWEQQAGRAGPVPLWRGLGALPPRGGHCGAAPQPRHLPGHGAPPAPASAALRTVPRPHGRTPGTPEPPRCRGQLQSIPLLLPDLAALRQPRWKNQPRTPWDWFP